MNKHRLYITIGTGILIVVYYFFTWLEWSDCEGSLVRGVIWWECVSK